MFASATSIVAVALALVVVHGQPLSVVENGKICTGWMITTGSQITVSIDQSQCGGSLAYEFGVVGTSYALRFCCPSRNPEPTPAPILEPPPEGCGRTAVAPIRTRIVGGQEARPHSWPWLVSLQYNNFHFCGGTLIDPYHVVTAAHCFQDSSLPQSQMKVVAGLHARSNPFTAQTQHRQIESIYNHEAYNGMTQENDIAVLRLAEPMVLNSYVNVACLPGPEPSLNGDVMIAGWGTTQFAGSSPDLLQQATIQVMEGCQNVYNFDPAKQVCAGNKEFTKDSCQGDSGGPLMHESNGQWVLTGAVSYGHECAKAGFPGVYAKVSYYMPWIKSKTQAS